MINMQLMRLAGEVSTIAKRKDLSYRIVRSIDDRAHQPLGPHLQIAMGAERVTVTPDLQIALEAMLAAVRDLRSGTVALIVDTF